MFKIKKTSLRQQIYLGVIFPLLMGMLIIFGLHMWREQELVEEQAFQAAAQIGGVINSSLRHSMLSHDVEMINAILADTSINNSVLRIQIVNKEGVITSDASLDQSEIGKKRSITDNGCIECHQYDTNDRPRLVIIPSSSTRSANVMRVISPIENSNECRDCHEASTSQLGMLFIDVPTESITEHIEEDLKIEIVILLVAILIWGSLLPFLLNKFILQRVEAIGNYLEAFAKGDYSVRLPENNFRGDELDVLALRVNDMAGEIEARAETERNRHQLLHKAVVEERERIARELHDGIAQLSGFVRVKASAVRLLLEREKNIQALSNLSQLEEAAGLLSIDVREAILGLKTSGDLDRGLKYMLGNYLNRFEKISSFHITVSNLDIVDSLTLSLESELNILHIVQEALSNARKHSGATEVKIAVIIENNTVHFLIEDNGVGFSPHKRSTDNLHFGLVGMRERAEAVGGKIEIQSEIGVKTRVTLTLPFLASEGKQNGH